jgi:DNA-binding transcriptional MerR regulator
MDHALSIGRLAEQSRTNTPTIRYYEQIGLLKRPDRRQSGHRVYGESDLRRLTFIRRCREFGFPIDQVRSLVDLRENGERPCAEARDVAAGHLEAVRAKLQELHALEASLAQLVVDCDTDCAGGPGSECVILEDLATPLGRGCCSAKA